MSAFQVDLREFTLNQMGTWLLTHVGRKGEGWDWVHQKSKPSVPDSVQVTIDDEMLAMQFKITYTDVAAHV